MGDDPQKMPDGTRWPTAAQAAEAGHAARYGEPPNYAAAEACEAYVHLLTHAVGVEACVRRLRELRQRERRIGADVPRE